jgi:uncharacterized protein
MAIPTKVIKVKNKEDKAKLEKKTTADNPPVLWQHAPVGSKNFKHDPKLMDNPPLFWPKGQKEENQTLNKNALKGDAEAQYQMGLQFILDETKETLKIEHVGKTEAQINVISASWLEKAAFQGNASAQATLGKMYNKGWDGIEENKERAFFWFYKAALQGNSTAQFELGVLYEYGIGVAKSNAEASAWYEKAAAQDHEAAQTMLGIMYNSGSLVTKLDKKTLEKYAGTAFLNLMFKSIVASDPQTEYMLGHYYLLGKGTKQNDKAAAEYFQKAAEKGHADAQSGLGVLYLTGKGVPQNFTEAAKWLRQAAEQEEEEAQFRLACLYQDGNGVQQSDKEAFRWCQKAAEQNHSKAQLMIATMYAEGKGVERNFATAREWAGKVQAGSCEWEATEDQGVQKLTGEGSKDMIAVFDLLRKIGKLEEESRACCRIM